MADSGRFLTLKQVAGELSSSVQQVRSLIKNGDIKAIRIGENGSTVLSVACLKLILTSSMRLNRMFLRMIVLRSRNQMM